MERQPGRLVEHLQNTQTRHRTVIQQLQAENMRCLADLIDLRLERDAFRKETARTRKENTELQNRLEEILTEYQDLKREKEMLARTMVRAGYMHGRTANPGFKILNTLSESDEEPEPLLASEATPTTTVGIFDYDPFPDNDTPVLKSIKEQVACPESETCLKRDLSSPEPSQPDPASNAVAVHNDSRSIPLTKTTLCRSRTTSS